MTESPAIVLTLTKAESRHLYYYSPTEGGPIDGIRPVAVDLDGATAHISYYYTVSGGPLVTDLGRLSLIVEDVDLTITDGRFNQATLSGHHQRADGRTGRSVGHRYFYRRDLVPSWLQPAITRALAEGVSKVPGA